MSDLVSKFLVCEFMLVIFVYSLQCISLRLAEETR